MTDIEIPLEKDRHGHYRFFEILPGLLAWSVLLSPFILSLINVNITVLFILMYMLLWSVKLLGLDVRALQGYRTMRQHEKLDWAQLIKEVQNGQLPPTSAQRPKWHYSNLARLKVQPAPVKPNDIIHVMMIATQNESREILEPTIQSVLSSNFDMKRVILVLAYEARGGARTASLAKELMDEYKNKFMDTFSVKHPDGIPGEVKGKGPNVTYAGHKLQKYLEAAGIDPLKAVVTTLDSDNRPHVNYLAALTYTYAVCPDPVHYSFQPIPMYTNNIWDAPTLMRVIATGSSFWNVVLSHRPHMLRNFSSHAQGMQSLIETDFWSVRTIVEDGHQFWRSYFAFDGNYEVIPIYVPIYQDAVLANGYFRTLKEQFIQLRRWAWGASDIAYVAEMGFFRPNKVSKKDLVMKFARLVEGHLSWATAPLIIAFAALVPAWINPKSIAANQLPLIASRIEQIALLGIVVSLYFSLKILPPRPERYKKHRTILMVLQWVLLPFATIVYNSLSALYSQTRLMFGKYLGTFNATEKAVITENKETIV